MITDGKKGRFLYHYSVHRLSTNLDPEEHAAPGQGPLTQSGQVL